MTQRLGYRWCKDFEGHHEMDCNVQVDDLKPLTEQFQSSLNGHCKLLEVQGLSTSHVSKAIGMTWRCKKPWRTTSESLSESHPGILYICCASLRLPGSWYWTQMFCSWFAKGQTWKKMTKREVERKREVDSKEGSIERKTIERAWKRRQVHYLHPHVILFNDLYWSSKG